MTPVHYFEQIGTEGDEICYNLFREGNLYESCLEIPWW